MQFPHRNRLISALSDKLLVIEARKHSGTLTTVSYALSQGKDVYALPGRVTDPLSEGCNKMIADGAGVLLSPSDILMEFAASAHNMGNENQLQENKANKNPEGKMGILYSLLNYEEKNLNQLACESGFPTEETAQILAEMELMGMCTQLSKDYFVKE